MTANSSIFRGDGWFCDEVFASMKTLSARITIKQIEATLLINRLGMANTTKRHSLVLNLNFASKIEVVS
ncbi:MAG: hypothetical protein QXO15_04895 [Nitrososphaerota archaeon]